MTMHLDNRISLARTSKPRQHKITKAEYAQLVEQHREYNKRMKQSNNRKLMMSFEEFANFCKPQTTKRAIAAGSRNHLPDKPYRRDGAEKTASIPSKGIGVGTGARKESTKYTGDYVKGIATLHKSNAVPVVNQQQAEDISRMRRG